MSKREHYVEKRKAPQQMGILKKVKKNQETFQTHGSCGRDSEYDNVCQFRLTAESCTIKSSIETLTSPVSYSYSFIYFDLETTGLEKDSDIIQIAAIHGEETFSIYCMPMKEISPNATKVNGLTKRDGKLYKEEFQWNM
ncbi:hypothetical protein KUTeg_020764 [Tegillarca granosa]|uniref:Exonuclease domain-containing protein n=1 Tax=Tegillarca granosa TaxID=220873 RepID=A0ABQ9E8Z3_TEGGR|nr:hypothetical protein KUTeg_020764 [Tegillarca granosa]